MKAEGHDRTIHGYNLQYASRLAYTDIGMPIIAPCDVTPSNMMGFNYLLTTKRYDAGIHFFLDDYQFERTWRYPTQYVDRLRYFECVLTPDFSLYRDSPLPLQHWNCYRSRFLGALWQTMGLQVIPTLQWSDSRSYSFAFEGMPTNSIVAVSTVGILNDRTATRLFINGFETAIDCLRPSLVLWYGKRIPGYEIPVDYRIYENMNVRRLKWVDVEHHQPAVQAAASQQ